MGWLRQTQGVAALGTWLRLVLYSWVNSDAESSKKKKREKSNGHISSTPIQATLVSGFVGTQRAVQFLSVRKKKERGGEVNWTVPQLVSASTPDRSNDEIIAAADRAKTESSLRRSN